VQYLKQDSSSLSLGPIAPARFSVSRGIHLVGGMENSGPFSGEGRDGVSRPRTRGEPGLLLNAVAVGRTGFWKTDEN